MAVIEINWKPTRTELRVFGGGLTLFCLVLGGWIFWRDGQFDVAESILVTLATVAGVVTVFVPSWLYPIYCVFMVVSYPIGWVMSHVILAIVFYGVFTPIGLIMRVLGRDPMQRRWDSTIDSYWVPHKSKGSTEDYFRQF
ncbi:MAG: hypothetical protein KDA84_13140 [Planctomycetaceae bacterium]|nr:hypothetical protein [Planctomycetaceae bacterium]